MSSPATQSVPRPPGARAFRAKTFPIKAKGAITALDWDGRVLRAAQSDFRGGQAEIDRVVVEPLELEFDPARTDPAAAGAALGAALKRLKLKPGAVVMGIPRSWLFLRTLSLPRAESDETLAAMVHFQINRDLPFRPEDAVIDFAVNSAPLPAPPAAPPPGAASAPAPTPAGLARIEVLVAVARREVVAFYEQVAAAAGLRLAALGFQSHANARGWQAGWPGGAGAAVALVSVRRREVIIDVVAGGEVLFSRTAGLGRAHETDEVPGTPADLPAAAGEDPRLLEAIPTEVVRTLHNYQAGEGRQPVISIVVAGETSQAPALVAALAERCRLPCEMLAGLPPSFHGVIPATISLPGESLTAIGLALAAHDQAPWPFNFLSPKRPPAARGWRRSSWVALAALVVLVLAGIWLVRGMLLDRRRATKAGLITQVDQAAHQRPLYRDMRVRAKGVHDWVGERKEWLDQWAALSALLPDPSQVYVTSIAAGSRGVLHVSLQARSGEILAQVDKRLREAGYDLRPPAITPSSDRYGYGFQTSLELTLPAKFKVDWKAMKIPPRPADDSSMERKK